ncbi:beta-galactosidase [Mariniphaga sp.]|uniref:beta-galactosidase n=1 Tax=Mariniphaga sp. TaxID=1954475 RepID=UPI003564D961
MRPTLKTRHIFIKATLFVLIILIFYGCSRFYKKPVTASFSLITEAQPGETWYPQRATESAEKKSFPVKQFHCDLSHKNGSLNLYFLQPDGFLEFTPESVGLPADWKGYSKLQLKFENSGNRLVNLLISLKGVRGILTDTLTIGPSQKLLFDMDITDLPLTAGNHPPYQPHYIQISGKEHNTELIIHSAKLSGGIPIKSQPVVDRFGQRISKNWPGKIHSEKELTSNRMDESNTLNQKLRTEWDNFGGWLNKPQLEATGFFRVEQVNGKYWFVTPSGRLFWSFGVTGIRPKVENVGCTKIKGREFLFEEIPSKKGKDSYVWTSDEDASFYCWNVIRKYPDVDEWRKTAFRRLDSWGYNTIGNWSEDSLIMQAEFPFTWSFRTTENKKLMLDNGIPDVFNGEWQQHIDSVFEKAAEYKDNPYLLGYFVDNEAGWGELDLLGNMPSNSQSRSAWLEFNQKKYRLLKNLNEQWGTAFKTWEDLKYLNVNLSSPDFLKDLEAFEILFAEQYFGSIRNTLKKYDPKHLYLGCRFTRKIKPEHICRVAGEFCDVVTVNVYAWAPTEEVMGEWYKRTGKPILIGEHHINLASERQVPATWGATPPDERRAYYKNYVETWAKTPWSLGCHWYQFTDQHITGRVSNGENQPIGLVDITDQPHIELIETAKELSGKIYEWHGNGRMN